MACNCSEFPGVRLPRNQFSKIIWSYILILQDKINSSTTSKHIAIDKAPLGCVSGLITASVKNAPGNGHRWSCIRAGNYIEVFSAGETVISMTLKRQAVRAQAKVSSNKKAIR
jgi:hypothetical protein